MIDDAGMEAARAAKARLRSLVRARIGAIPPAERARADQVICERLASLASEVGAAFILGYLALPDEVRLDSWLAAMVEEGRVAILPRAGGGRLRYGRWQPGAKLTRDEEGVLAPEVAPLEALPAESGLIVVPGRAFDESGGRLGRGGGYYDRLLAAVDQRQLVVGAAYECQIVERVPREEHDRTVAVVVTQAVRRAASGSAGR